MSTEISPLTEESAQSFLESYRAQRKTLQAFNEYKMYFDPNYYLQTVWVATGVTCLVFIILGILLIKFAKEKIDGYIGFVIFLVLGLIVFGLGAGLSSNINDDLKSILKRHYKQYRLAEIILSYPHLLSEEARKRLEGDKVYSVDEQIYWDL